MKKIICYSFLFFILIFFPFEKIYSITQAQNAFKLESVSSLIELNKYWKYRSGDNLQWADPELDDNKWDTINVRLPLVKVSDSLLKGIIWFRLHLLVDSNLVNKVLTLQIMHQGASEIYLDGKLIHNFGKPSSNNSKEERFNPKNFPISILFNISGRHLLAVRYSNLKAYSDYKLFKDSNPGFAITIGNGDLAITHFQYYLVTNTSIFLCIFGFLIALTLLHFFLYLFYRTNKSNLHYSQFTLRLGLCFLLVYISIVSFSPAVKSWSFLIEKLIFFGAFIPLLNLVQSLFNSLKPKWISILKKGILIAILPLFTHFFQLSYILLLIIGNVIFFIIIKHTIKAIKEKKEGAWIIGTGILSFLSLIIIYSFFIFIAKSYLISNWGVVALVVLGILSIPISMSVYLARDFAKTNKNLQLQLIQVRELSFKTIEQEKEKKKILESQKEELEIQVAQRTHELAEKNKDILDSISYAKRIQKAILPDEEIINRHLPESFILYKPKDIVSGDFYWFHSAPSDSSNSKELLHIAAADCTGHGVPGALMSMIGSEKLNDAVSQSIDTSEILKLLNNGIKTSLRQSDREESTRDGMDIALCSIDLETRIVKYAGANRPVWIIRSGQATIEEIKATKKAIGGLTEDNQHFDTHEIQLLQGDTFYISTDGYADQFSKQDQKLTTKKFKEILIGIQDKTMQEQEKHLDNFIEIWKTGAEQIDDILVIGIRL